MRKFWVIRIYLYIISIMLVLSVSTLFAYQVVLSKSAREQMYKKRFEKKTIYAKRGDIVSSDGHKIVFDIEKYKIKLDPTHIDDQYIEKVSEILAPYVEKDKEEVKDLIISAKVQGKRNYEFKTLINYFSQKELKDKLKKLKIRSKWIFFAVHSERVSVVGNEFESILGFINSLQKGVYGVENYYNNELQGVAGEKLSFIPAAPSLAANTLPYLTEEKILKEPKEGYNVQLTVDSVMQFNLSESLKKAYENFSAASVMGILMEADTGKIIAMDSFPKSTNKAEIKNRTITDLFEPGSIFKPITVSIAMEEGLINKNTIINSEGFIRVKNRIIHDHDNSTKGDLTVSEIVTHSGNVAMVKIGQMLDTEKLYNGLIDFGLASKTGIDTSYETYGKLFKLASFSEVRKSNVSFGQGISMTQLQMLNSLNATINGGELLKPYIVEKILDKKNKVVRENKKTIVHKPISEATSKQIREILENVVTSGTGRNIAIEGYRIGGKTGTAQKAGPRGYEKGKYFSSFFAFLPADKPKYSVLITVNEPKGAYYGASVALPVAREVIEKLIKYKNLKPSFPIQTNVKPNVEEKVVIKKVSIDKIKNDLENKIMPNFIGHNLKELVNKNILTAFNIKVNGNGVVYSQNIEAGTTLLENQEIIINLK